jgi:hypothetical protein
MDRRRVRRKRILAALSSGAAALVVLALAVPVSAGSPDLAAKLAKGTGARTTTTS